MNKLRKPTDEDQELADKACKLMNDIIQKHPEIEPALWMAGVWTATVNAYIDAGHTWEDFKKENEARMRHYKGWWD